MFKSSTETNPEWSSETYCQGKEGVYFKGDNVKACVCLPMKIDSIKSFGGTIQLRFMGGDKYYDVLLDDNDRLSDDGKSIYVTLTKEEIASFYKFCDSSGNAKTFASADCAEEELQNYKDSEAFTAFLISKNYQNKGNAVNDNDWPSPHTELSGDFMKAAGVDFVGISVRDSSGNQSLESEFKIQNPPNILYFSGHGERDGRLTLSKTKKIYFGPEIAKKYWGSFPEEVVLFCCSALKIKDYNGEDSRYSPGEKWANLGSPRVFYGYRWKSPGDLDKNTGNERRSAEIVEDWLNTGRTPIGWLEAN